MLKIFRKYNLFTLLFLSIIVNLTSDPIFAQKIAGSIPEDDLETRQGLPWGGRNWPYSQIVDIKDSLVSTPVGRIVIDRHEERGGIIDLFGNPPKPGKKVFISFWGSKIEGCFVELIIQVAPLNTLNKEAVAPTLLEIGVGEQIVRLIPQNTNPVIWTTNYTYEEYANGNNVTKNGTWYMGRQLFVIDKSTAQILAQAPSKEAKARITFANNETIIFPIGSKTVSKWQAAYSFNPACTSLN